MIKHLCRCGYERIEIKRKKKFDELSKSWKCPSCKKGKAYFMRIEYTKDFESAPLIKASYNSMKEWRLDTRKCFFTIKPFNEEKVIRVNYYLIENGKHKLKLRIEGKNGEDIYNTIIKNKLIGSLQHSAYLGYELAKAEFSLKMDIPYVQDDPIRGYSKTLIK